MRATNLNVFFLTLPFLSYCYSCSFNSFSISLSLSCLSFLLSAACYIPCLLFSSLTILCPYILSTCPLPLLSYSSSSSFGISFSPSCLSFLLCYLFFICYIPCLLFPSLTILCPYIASASLLLPLFLLQFFRYLPFPFLPFASLICCLLHSLLPITLPYYSVTIHYLCFPHTPPVSPPVPSAYSFSFPAFHFSYLLSVTFLASYSPPLLFCSHTFSLLPLLSPRFLLVPEYKRTTSSSPSSLHLPSVVTQI